MSLKTLVYRAKRPFHFVKTGLLEGVPAQILSGFPHTKLKVLAITGTDGKTSSSTLLYHVLKTAGKKVALLSTVAAYVGDEEIDTGFHVTSPNPKPLYRFLRKMVDQGYEYVVMETTSHGLYQFRTWGIKPEIAGITNIAHEHIDYHVTHQLYLEAKALLFKKAKTVVLNADDASHYKLRKLSKKDSSHILTYSAQEKLPPKIASAIKERFPEVYNQMNARLVTTMAQALGVENAQIAQGITTFPGVAGRMEEIPNKKSFTVIVDFAHTPQGLEAALRALRARLNKQGSGRLIAVFGCAGLRDRLKRPVMGKLGADLADYCVFTAEDPRTEDVWAIIRQMKEQLTEGHDKIMSIANRKETIEFALTKLAKKGDIIAIFGKGHEKSMSYGKTEYPWSDQQAVREILA